MAIRRPGKLSYSSLGVSLDNYNLTNISGEIIRFLFTGNQFVIAEYDATSKTVELNYWDTDGSEAVSRVMDKANVLDLYYDSTDSMYYVLRWGDNNGTPGVTWTAPTVFKDEFDSGVRTPSEALWSLSKPLWGGYSHHEQDPSTETVTVDSVPWEMFRQNTSDNRLEYKSVVGRGVYSTTAAVTGNFQAWSTLYLTTFSGSDSYFSMRLIDRGDSTVAGIEADNLLAQASIRGTYIHANLPSDAGAWESAYTYLSLDSTGGKWAVTGLRLIEKNFSDVSYGLSYGSVSTFDVSFYQYSATDDTNYFKVSDSGGSALGYGVVSNSSHSFCFVDGPIGFTLKTPDGILGNLVGTSVRINVQIDNTVSAGSTTLSTVTGDTGFYVGVGINGTNVYTRRDVDGPLGGSSWENIQVYTSASAATTPLGVEVFADTVGAASLPDLQLDDFTIESSTGTVGWPSIPSLTLETFDVTGTRSQLSGISDANGVAIATLDVLNVLVSGTSSFEQFREQGFASITTSAPGASPGQVYVAVSRYEWDTPVVYSIDKSALPISTWSSSSPTITASGSLENIQMLKTGSFMYTDYATAEIAYITTNWADINYGDYVNTLSSGSLVPVTPRKVAWLQSSDFYAWNIVDTDALYGIDTPATVSGSGPVKLYDVTSTTAAFCNVVSASRLLPAGTNQTSTVTAEVMNIYGTALSGKTVNFSVTSGDGSVSPASATTNSGGVASTTYTVGTAVSTTEITATVSI